MDRLQRIAEAVHASMPAPRQQAPAAGAVSLAASRESMLATVGELPAAGEDWPVPSVPMTDEQKFFFVRVITSDPWPLHSPFIGLPWRVRSLSYI